LTKSVIIRNEKNKHGGICIKLPNSIFRKKSLETLSSPEQLNLVMQVTRPMGWVSLVACFLLMGIAVFWGFKGKIHTITQGEGILLREGAIYDVVSLGTGQVKSIHVQVNDTVKADQVIAHLSLPDLDHQLKEAQDRLMNLESERLMIHNLGDKKRELKLKTLANERQTLDKAIAAEKENLAFLEKEVAHLKDFLEKELTTRSEVQEVKNQYEKAMQNILDYQRQLNDISDRDNELLAQTRKERFTVEHKISQARLKISALEEDRNLQSRIVSSRSGKVLEIYKNSGKVIQTGEPLISLEVEGDTGNNLSAFLYFTPRDGKKVKQGMAVRISPSTVKMEEDGYMLGRVRQVSGFPASQKGMLRLLQNQDLVSSLSANGAPIFVTADLLADESNLNGYQWSSARGPDIGIESGTLCSADIVVQSHAPIRLVLPFLKKNVLGIGEGLFKRGQK